MNFKYIRLVARQLVLLFFLGTAFHLNSQQEPTTLPLIYIDDLIYMGAFRLPSDEYGMSSLNYSEGPIEYNAVNQSLYIVGHNHDQAIAEFEIPALINSQILTELNMATDPVQDFDQVLDETSGGNPQNMNRIGGMECIEENGNQKLIVNAYEYYDAPADNTHTTLRLNNRNDIINSGNEGYFEFEGGAGHASGWLSPIPLEWQSLLDGTHMAGHSSGIPIISRTSVGPSAFSFYPEDMINISPGQVTNNTLLDFSLEHPLHDDLSNESLTNDLWTHLSRATYGLILPGTRSYLTIGYSGGHASGVCYKCTQSDGHTCGGYCAHDANDYDQYYWLWDVNELLDVKNGLLNPYELMPYAYGPFDTPFENPTKQLGGGTFDPVNNLLYLSVQKGDTLQGTYANPPVIIAFTYSLSTVAAEISDFTVEASGTTAILSWKYYDYKHVNHIEIQMRKVSSDWKTTDSIQQKDIEQNTVFLKYQLRDLEAGEYFFRIKLAKQDENYLYSPIRSVQINESSPSWQCRVFPNPARLAATAEIKNLSEGQTYQLEVFSPASKFTVQLYKGYLAAGDQLSLTLDQSILPYSGIYFLRILSGTKQEVIRFSFIN